MALVTPLVSEDAAMIFWFLGALVTLVAVVGLGRLLFR